MRNLVSDLFCIAAGAAILWAAPASAGDKGPQYQTTTMTTNAVIGTTIAIPIGDTGRFTPTYMLIKGTPAGVTNQVKWVNMGITNTYRAETTASLLALTNFPTMFYGDRFILIPHVALATSDTVTVTVMGTVFD